MRAARALLDGFTTTKVLYGERVHENGHMLLFL